MKQYDLIIFDWDGTLMDSADKIVNCMQLAAEHCDLPVPTAESVRHIIGISLREAIAQLFGLTDDNKLDDMIAAYKTVYLERDVTPCPLFEGVHDMLGELKQRPHSLAVATGKARRGLDRAWRNTATGHYFSSSRCADEAQSKPSPDMLKQLLALNNVAVERALMIGDSIYDMQMAEAIGMDRVAVSYGVHQEHQLKVHKPREIVHSIAELSRFLIR